jgi:hypothetical protein
MSTLLNLVVAHQREPSGTSSALKRMANEYTERRMAVDFKGLGYFISTISVFLLGIVAWPTPEEPRWKAIAVSLGMTTSILGMGVRWLSHRKDRKDIERAEADAAHADGKAGGIP